MWHFKKAAYDDTIKTSKLAQFFSSNTCEAVVREAVQNSLDAQADNNQPVKMSFSFGTTQRSSFKDMYDPLERHLQETGYDSSIPDEIRYVVIEDFNTKGLEGDISKSGTDKASFYSFWWQEGQGTKKKGSGGSHGVGKSTLSNASKLKSFLALTVRDNAPQTALLGFCDLPPHELSGDLYLGYARFGHETSDDGQKELLPQTPEKNADTIEKFKTHAGLKRNDETGLSVFIPEINEDFDAKETIREVITNYFLPVVKGDLVIEIEDKNGSDSCKINKETISQIAEEYFTGEEEQKEILLLLKIAESIAQSKQKSNYFGNISELSKDDTRLSAEMFSEQNLKDMRKEFNEGKVVPLQITIPIKRKDRQETATGHMRAYVLNEKCKSKYYKAFRGNVLINKEKCRSPASYSALIIDIENFDGNELSEYLKYTEDPGHCEWKNSAATNSKGRYATTEAWVKTAVQQTASAVLNILCDVDDNEKIANFAEDIFFIETTSKEKTSNDNSRSKKKKGSDKPDPPPPIPPKNPVLFDRRKIDQGGIEVFASSELKEKFANDPAQHVLGQIRAAHVMPASSKSKWFNEYSPADFSFTETIEIDSKGIEPIEVKDNVLIFKVTEPDFLISLKGFDTNRDVHFEINKVREQ